MRTIKYLLLTATVLSIFSCDNSLEVSEPSFDVSTDKSVYKINDTVRFYFSGDVEYLTFYSGDSGHEYKHKERTEIEEAKPVLTFTSSGRYGPPERNLSLLVATNFSGAMNAQAIKAANWMDISDKVNFSAGTVVQSGPIDVSEFTKDAQVHFAFKYVGIGNTPQPQKTWSITELSLKTYDPSGKVFPLFDNLSQAGWLQFSVEGATRSWRITATELWLGANPNEPSNEDWVISKAVNLAAINPDKGVPLKTLTASLEPLTYSYKSAGEYVVTFVAKNQSIYGEKEVIKEIHITITE